MYFFPNKYRICVHAVIPEDVRRKEGLIKWKIVAFLPGGLYIPWYKDMFRRVPDLVRGWNHWSSPSWCTKLWSISSWTRIVTFRIDYFHGKKGGRQPSLLNYHTCKGGWNIAVFARARENTPQQCGRGNQGRFNPKSKRFIRITFISDKVGIMWRIFYKINKSTWSLWRLLRVICRNSKWAKTVGKRIRNNVMWVRFIVKPLAQMALVFS